MTNLTIQIDDAVLSETDNLLEQLQVKRDEYINQAVTLLNRLQKRKILGQQLELESKMVRDDSMKILAEFESLNDAATAI